MRSFVLSLCPLALLVLLQVAWGQDSLQSISSDVPSPVRFSESTIRYGVSPVYKDLLEDASDVFETIRVFMTTLGQLDRIRMHEGKRENDIRRYGVKRADNGFQITGWRKKRSTMESDLFTSMFTGRLDHMAKETLKAIYTFVDGMEKARNYYENREAQLEIPNSYQSDTSGRQRDVV